MAPLTGRVHGTTIDLDVAPNPPFEGKRVRVVLELVDDDGRPDPDEHARAWSAWLATGPDGPIVDDAAPEFPRRTRRPRTSALELMKDLYLEGDERGAFADPVD